MNKTFGEKIRNLRENIPWDQTSLADEIGVNVKTIQRVENDKNIPRKETIKKLGAALEIDYDELIKYLPNADKIANDDEVIFYQVRYGREFYNLFKADYSWDIDYHWNIVGGERFELIHVFHRKLHSLSKGIKGDDGLSKRYSNIDWDYGLGKILASMRKEEMGVYIKPYVLQHIQKSYKFGNTTKHLQIYIMPDDVEYVKDIGNHKKQPYARLSKKYLKQKNDFNSIFYFNEDDVKETNAYHEKVRESQIFGCWYEFTKLHEKNKKEWTEIYNDDYFGHKVDSWIAEQTEFHIQVLHSDSEFFIWGYMQDGEWQYLYNNFYDKKANEWVQKKRTTDEIWKEEKESLLKEEIENGQAMAKEIIEAFRFKINPKKKSFDAMMLRNCYFHNYHHTSGELSRDMERG